MLYITNDENAVLRCFNNAFKLIDLSENKNQINTSFDVLKASILLPPPDTVAMYLDGSMDRFIFSYHEYLSTPNCYDFILLMYTASAIYNTNLCIYLDNKDEMGALTLTGVSNYFTNYVGLPNVLNINGIEAPISLVQPGAFLQMLDIVYMNGIIPGKQYLVSYPSEMKLNYGSVAVTKLINELAIWSPTDSSYEGKCKVLEEYRQQMLSSGKFLDIPIVQALEEFMV